MPIRHRLELHRIGAGASPSAAPEYLAGQCHRMPGSTARANGQRRSDCFLSRAPVAPRFRSVRHGRRVDHEALARCRLVTAQETTAVDDAHRAAPRVVRCAVIEPAFYGSDRPDDLCATAACEPRPYRAYGAHGRSVRPSRLIATDWRFGAPIVEGGAPLLVPASAINRHGARRAARSGRVPGAYLRHARTVGVT